MAGTPVKANIDGKWLAGKKLESKKLEMLNSFSDSQTVLVEIDGKEIALDKSLVRVFEYLMVDEAGNKPKLEEFKKEEFKILLDYLSPRYTIFNGYKIYIDWNRSEKIYIDYNKSEISHEKAKIYPAIKEYEYKHAFVEYPCWIIEQVGFDFFTSTSTPATAKLFLEILSPDE